LDARFFSRLETAVAPTARRLEASVLRLFLAHAYSQNRLDKINEFFDKCGAELQSQPEWKEWFGAHVVK
jgi:hypothetical protein